MNVFALVFTIGYASGYEALIGMYSTKEKAEKKAKEHMRKYGHTSDNYSIKKIEIDKEANIILAEW